jgi:hypothetical protein
MVAAMALMSEKGSFATLGSSSEPEYQWRTVEGIAKVIIRASNRFPTARSD